MPYQVVDVWFCDVERPDGNLTQALAQLSNLDVSRDAMLNAVDCVDSRSHGTINAQVDCQDVIAIPINVGDLMQARMVLNGLGVVGRNGAHVVVEACVCRAK